MKSTIPIPLQHIAGTLFPERIAFWRMESVNKAILPLMILYKFLKFKYQLHVIFVLTQIKILTPQTIAFNCILKRFKERFHIKLQQQTGDGTVLLTKLT